MAPAGSSEAASASERVGRSSRRARASGMPGKRGGSAARYGLSKPSARAWLPKRPSQMTREEVALLRGQEGRVLVKQSLGSGGLAEPEQDPGQHGDRGGALVMVGVVGQKALEGGARRGSAPPSWLGWRPRESRRHPLDRRPHRWPVCWPGRRPEPASAGAGAGRSASARAEAQPERRSMHQAGKRMAHFYATRSSQSTAR
jgi:hypothetical protein